MAHSLLRPFTYFFIIILGLSLYSVFGEDFLSLEQVQLRLQQLHGLKTQSPFFFLSGFIGLFVLMITVSLPGTIVLTLLAGALYGAFWGTLIVELASTMGATLAFLLSRYLLKDFLRQRLESRYHRMNTRFEREGKAYLFTLRLFPAAPFVLINLIMGLTTLSAWNYVWITLVGMLPGNILYVLAGENIHQFNSLAEIITSPILVGLIFLSLLPYGWKAVGRYALSRSLRHNGPRKNF